MNRPYDHMRLCFLVYIILAFAVQVTSMCEQYNLWLPILTYLFLSAHCRHGIRSGLVKMMAIKYARFSGCFALTCEKRPIVG